MWFGQLVTESWNILRESAAFILVGFAIAGLLHVALARGRWANWLRGLGARSVVLASAVGLPLPLCSCSVLPAAVSLRKQGASKGATLSFLISTPETSVQSVLLTYALLGPIMAIYRPLASWITAMTAGLAQNFVERRFPSSEPDVDQADPSTACCAGGECRDEAPLADGAQKPDWRAGMRHAFVDIFDDVIGWMLLGVVVAAAIQVLVPGFILDAMFGSPLQAMLIMLVIGVPLYVCAESSTPIAAVLIAQGISPGAALVFLLAGPATNIGSVGVLLRQLGRRTVVIYLVSIAIVSVVMGLALDWFFGAKGITLSERALAEPFLPGWFKTLGALVFLTLAVASMRRLRAYERLSAGLDRLLPLRVTPRRLTLALVIVVLIAYAASGLVAIQPGEVGMLKTFGRVTKADAAPGLHYVWPWPVGSVDRVPTRRVYRLVLGESASSEEPDPDEDRSWVLLGDENIANIKCTAHWRMAPGATRAFAYASTDPELHVRDAVRSALREVLGAANIDTVFTVDQAALGDAVLAEAQRTLGRRACGVELVAFNFLDLHAPAEVHEAFRDVASALEDKVTRRNQALARKAEIEPLARGAADKMITAAIADKVRVTAEASGEADGFLQTLAAFKDYPELTRLRMILETFDKVLPGLRKCIRPGTGNLELDLRFGGERDTAEPAF